MPKNKLQEVIFSLLMVLAMVYAMVCYNIALAQGGLHNAVFLLALRELPIMAPVAFALKCWWWADWPGGWRCAWSAWNATRRSW